MKSKWFGLCLIVGLLMPCVVMAMETEFQMKSAWMQVRDNGDMQGNRFMTGIGLSLTGGKDFYWNISPELWTTGTNDYESISGGYGLFSQVGYRLHYGKLEIIPVVGPYVGRWERGGNAKFPNSWTYINYVDVAYGVNLNYKWTYAKLDLINPLVHQSNVRTSVWQEPREYVEVGVKLKNWSFGVFRRTYDFEKIDNNMFMHGFQLGYKY
jgi:hypothetical protein